MHTVPFFFAQCICEYGSHVITGSWDKSAIMWDVVRGHRLLTFTGHTEGELPRSSLDHAGKVMYLFEWC